MSIWVPALSSNIINVGDLVREYNNYWECDVTYLVVNIHPTYYDTAHDTSIETCYDLLSLDHPEGSDLFHITGMEDFAVLR